MFFGLRGRKNHPQRKKKVWERDSCRGGGRGRKEVQLRERASSLAWRHPWPVKEQSGIP